MTTNTTRNAGIGLGAGAVVLVAAIFTIIQRDEPAKEAPAEPKVAELTINRAAGIGIGADDHYTLGLHAIGAAPTEPALLVDADGDDTATLTPMPCPADGLHVERFTGLVATEAAPDTLWCFDVTGPAPGDTVTGTLAGSAANVKVTLGQRHAFMWLPFVAIAFGFSAGLLAHLWPNFLRNHVLVSRKRRAFATNKAAKAPRTIFDLEQRVARWESSTLTLDQSVQKVEWLVRTGAFIGMEQRVKLLEAVSKTSSLAGCGLFDDALRTLDRLNDRGLSVDDLLDEKLDRRDGLGPIAAALIELAKAWAFTQSVETKVADLPADTQSKIRELIVAARAAIRSTDTVEEIGEARSAVSALQKAATAASMPAVAYSASRKARLEAEPPDADLNLWKEDRLSRFLTVITALAAMCAGYLSLYFAVYAPAQTFGTVADYFTLIGTAVASSAVVSVITVAGYWRTSATFAASADGP